MPSIRKGAWRNAASLILVQRASEKSSKISNGCDYKVLMVKRSSKSSFMPNALVFPGGVTDDTSDFSNYWTNIISPSRNVSLPPGTTRPLMVESSNQPDSLDANIAFRLTAIRETFEESGVFLAQYHNTPADEGAMSEWCSRVRKDPTNFFEMCQQLNASPDVSGLYEWSCWLTPLNMTNTKSSGRRFDTLFYTHFINDPVEVDLDNQEVTESVWTSPAEALEAYTEKKVWLAPPQVWELSRMRNFSKFDELKNFAQDREARGTPTWLPVLVKCKDGTLALYPGDSLYPERPDFYGTEEPLNFEEKSMWDFSLQTTDRNRMLQYSPNSVAISCNISDPNGHKVPVSLDQFLNLTRYRIVR